MIGGGLPLIRPNLHFIYNLVETAPLVVAFAFQLKLTYDEWLAKALPHLTSDQLVEMTNRLETLRVDVGGTIVRQGEPADRFYIIVKGSVEVVRSEPDGPAGKEVRLATLGPGQFFGEVGLMAYAPRTASVVATTPVELLAMDRTHFRRVVGDSEATSEDLEAIAMSRLAELEATSPQAIRLTPPKT